MICVSCFVFCVLCFCVCVVVISITTGEKKKTKKNNENKPVFKTITENEEEISAYVFILFLVLFSTKRVLPWKSF